MEPKMSGAEMSTSESFLPFEMNYLPDFVLKKAVTELNETQKAKIQQLEALKVLITSSEKITDINFENDFLRTFLRKNKYDVFKAFVQLQNFIHFRRKYSSLFKSLPEEYFLTKKSTEYFSILPNRDPNGCTVVLLELGKWDPEELELADFKRLTLSMYLQLLRDPMTQINGFHIIHDFKGTSIKHLRYCTPQNLYFLYHGAIHCIPARDKKIHMVNESVAMRALWAIMKHFVSEKLSKRIFFHSNPEDLLNFLPRSILPVQYGGEISEYHDKNMIKRMNMAFGKTPLGGDPNYF